MSGVAVRPRDTYMHDTGGRLPDAEQLYDVLQDSHTFRLQLTAGPLERESIFLCRSLQACTWW